MRHFAQRPYQAISNHFTHSFLLATIHAFIYLNGRRKRRFSGASALLQRKKRAKATQNTGFRR